MLTICLDLSEAKIFSGVLVFVFLVVFGFP